MSKKNGTIIKCKECNKAFYIPKCKIGVKKFCSNKCYYKFSKGKPSKNIKTCFQKGAPPWNKGKKASKQARLNMSLAHVGKNIGEKNPAWKGGRILQSTGYVYLYLKNHPFTDKQHYYPEHRLVAEKYIKRFLEKTEVIHHINGVRSDNRPENLYLFNSQKEHASYHKNLQYNNIEPITKSNLL